MKEHELRQLSTCAVCGKKLLHAGLPLFWRVTIERFGIDIGAVRRLDGLAAMLGSPQLASIMGPDEDMAKPVMDSVRLVMCDPCAVERDLPVAALGEIGADQADRNGDQRHHRCMYESRAEDGPCT